MSESVSQSVLFHLHHFHAVIVVVDFDFVVVVDDDFIVDVDVDVIVKKQRNPLQCDKCPSRVRLLDTSDLGNSSINIQYNRNK